MDWSLALTFFPDLKSLSWWNWDPRITLASLHASCDQSYHSAHHFHRNPSQGMHPTTSVAFWCAHLSPDDPTRFPAHLPLPTHLLWSSIESQSDFSKHKAGHVVKAAGRESRGLPCDSPSQSHRITLPISSKLKRLPLQRMLWPSNFWFTSKVVCFLSPSASSPSHLPGFFFTHWGHHFRFLFLVSNCNVNLIGEKFFPLCLTHNIQKVD